MRNKDTVFAQLERRQGAAWRLLLSGGYLKVLDVLGGNIPPCHYQL
ncbi:MAG: hypothetical protein HFH43_06770 [Lachnospiraceae bacterium]|nr:hypothetical protein [Lachnospiraceae bacterium]